MNALLYVLRQSYRFYEMFRERWPVLSAWLIVVPMILSLVWFVLSFPIAAAMGTLIWAAELRYSKVI